MKKVSIVRELQMNTKILQLQLKKTKIIQIELVIASELFVSLQIQMTDCISSPS